LARAPHPRGGGALNSISLPCLLPWFFTLAPEGVVIPFFGLLFGPERPVLLGPEGPLKLVATWLLEVTGVVPEGSVLLGPEGPFMIWCPKAPSFWAPGGPIVVSASCSFLLPPDPIVWIEWVFYY